MELLRSAFASPWVESLALLLLCAAYLQGAFDKARDFRAAVAEMRQFGLAPAAPLAAATIALEAVASAMVVSGWGRWLGALALCGFTLLATLLAARFWTLPAPQRRPMANTFFEHLGLAGAFLLVAIHDVQ